DTVGPEVEVSVVSQTYDRKPPVVVTARDLYGLSSPATVVLDADLNNDLDFADAGESSFATMTLSSGMAVFQLYSTLLAVGTTTYFRARVSDSAGNQT